MFGAIVSGRLVQTGKGEVKLRLNEISFKTF